MKYLLIFILFLTFIQSASAARLVPGNLPSTTPLLPLPEDTAPNYQGSINFSAEPEASTPVLDEPVSPTQPDEKGRAGINNDNKKSSSENKNTAWLALALVLAVILAYGFWRKKFAKKI